jgi:hypothetical protein
VISIYSIMCIIDIMQIVKEDTSFRQRALAALGVSVIADTLDYFAAPLFSTPLIGDIFDSFITGLLYSITKSKLSTAINMAEFIPFIGDLIPIYTLSTLMWISKESKNYKRIERYQVDHYKNRINTDIASKIRRQLKRLIL